MDLSSGQRALPCLPRAELLLGNILTMSSGTPLVPQDLSESVLIYVIKGLHKVDEDNVLPGIPLQGLRKASGGPSVKFSGFAAAALFRISGKCFFQQLSGPSLLVRTTSFLSSQLTGVLWTFLFPLKQKKTLSSRLDIPLLGRRQCHRFDSPYLSCTFYLSVLNKCSGQLLLSCFSSLHLGFQFALLLEACHSSTHFFY